MPTDPRKRQRKLERRAAKRKEKKHHLVKETQQGIGERLAAAAVFPVLHSFITEDLWKQGLGWALLSRQLPTGQVAVALYLVDRFCLGVKDVMITIINRSEYDSELLRKLRKDVPAREVSPATVRKLVEEAVAYAAELGLHPHPDHDKAKLLFGDIDAGQSTEVFEFGKGGKPLFIAGPLDTPARCRHIVNTLERTRGSGQYNFVVPAGPFGGPEAVEAVGEDFYPEE